MALPTDLPRLDATAQAELVRNGDVSAAELVDAAIARIEAINPQLNAVIHERFEKARAEAAGTLPDGPFRGVPFLLKDLETRSLGDPHHAGTEFLKNANFISDRNDYAQSVEHRLLNRRIIWRVSSRRRITDGPGCTCE